MAKLYELTNQYRVLQEFIEDGDQDGFELALSQIQDSIGLKLEGYAAVIKNLESDIEGMTKEIKRLQDRKKSYENNIIRMKVSMQEALETVEGNKVKGEKFTFSLRKSETVHILDENMLPIQYLKPAQPTIDKVSIKKDLKNEISVPGAEIKINKNLQIK